MIDEKALAKMVDKALAYEPKKLQRTLKNRTIFCRDNLDILRGINSNSIDLIYLDPPFNKGKIFHAPVGSSAEGADFDDIWTPDIVKDEWHNQINDSYPKLFKYLDAVGDIGSRSSKYYLIYMAVRLIEMHRILKDTGSIYLHCDPTASHYLKLLLDTLFGHSNFRNEIVWHYGGRGAKAISKQFSKNHDVIFFYSKSNNFYFAKQNIISKINFKGSGYRIDKKGKCFRTSPRGDYTDESIKRLDVEGRIHRTKTGTIRIKYFEEYEKDKEGNPTYVYENKQIGSTWNDIADAMHMPKLERTGYPTQKPIALLERIIKASSKEGDLVLDPFCGCATTCIAAERLDRQWIGIDVSVKAYDLVKMRLEKAIDENRSLPEPIDPILRKDIPKRTDVSHKKKPTKEDKTLLYGKQNGNCDGCNTHFSHARHFHIDHIIPQVQGGSHELDNLQLLCGSCNSMKGDRPMEYLKAKLKKDFG